MSLLMLVLIPFIVLLILILKRAQFFRIILPRIGKHLRNCNCSRPNNCNFDFAAVDRTVDSTDHNSVAEVTADHAVADFDSLEPAVHQVGTQEFLV